MVPGVLHLGWGSGFLCGARVLAFEQEAAGVG